MNVLVLTVSTGQGHHSTGQAIVEYINRSGNEAKMVDAYGYISPLISESIQRSYLLTTKYTKKACGKVYRQAEKADLTRHENFVSVANHVLGNLLKPCIEEFQPDVIVCTHVMATQLLEAYMKKYKHKNVITMGIITDFTIHPYWEGAKIDYFITASELLGNQIRKKKIPLEKVRAFGIPIKEKFAHKYSREEACAKLGIENKTTVLVMSGSMGYGNVIKHVRALDELDMDFQIIVACGNNKAMKKKIDKMKHQKTIYTYGFVDMVDLMMDAAECIVTKPGGLSVSEALAKGLPLILMNPIPGQEDRNLEFLLNNGLAQYITETYPVDEAVYQLLSNSWRLENQKNGIRAVGKPYATRDLCEFILEVGNGSVENR